MCAYYLQHLYFYKKVVKPEKKIDANGKQVEDYWASSKKVYILYIDESFQIVKEWRFLLY